MAVLKNLRNLSDMEFYKNAIDIRKELSIWMLKDFGTKRNIRNVKTLIHNISQDDEKTIREIYEKYGFKPDGNFECVFPSWFLDSERKVFMDMAQQLIQNIVQANSVYATNQAEHDLRRNYQDAAVGNCYSLTNEIQYVCSIFKIDLNQATLFLDKVEREVELLKGWRRSDNQKRKSKDSDK